MNTGNVVKRVLLVLYVITCTPCQQQLIEYPLGCVDYTVSSGKGPMSLYEDTRTGASAEECKRECSVQPDCGGFTFLESNGECAFYNLNDAVISDHLSNKWYWNAGGYAWYSKTCPYTLDANYAACDDYSHSHAGNERIKADWLQNTFEFASLPLSECHSWCTITPGCRSVIYNKRQDKEGYYCYLYNVTISALKASGHGDQVVTYTGRKYHYTTYDKHCDGNGQYVTTSTTEDCTFEEFPSSFLSNWGVNQIKSYSAADVLECLDECRFLTECKSLDWDPTYSPGESNCWIFHKGKRDGEQVRSYQSTTHYEKICEPNCDNPPCDGDDSPTTTSECIDKHDHCPFWADTGECDVNPNYMQEYCPLSCDACQDSTAIGNTPVILEPSESYVKPVAIETTTTGYIIPIIEPPTTTSSPVTTFTPQSLNRFPSVATGNNACGKPIIQPILGSTRIVGGKEAIRGSWPWQIEMRVEGIGQACGGTLISTNWVLTAAHCFNNFESESVWSLHVGSHLTTEVDVSEQSSRASQIIIHPSYNRETVDSDIALVKLSTAFTLGNYASPACLPDVGEKISGEQQLFATGFGKTFGTGSQNRLKQVRVPYVRREVCRQAYAPDPITTNMLCAGYVEEGGQDACQGDSGGPLVGKKGDTWYLFGIVSWGRGCARPGFPGIYTKVSNYIPWILWTTENS